MPSTRQLSLASGLDSAGTFITAAFRRSSAAVKCRFLGRVSVLFGLVHDCKKGLAPERAVRGFRDKDRRALFEAGCGLRGLLVHEANDLNGNTIRQNELSRWTAAANASSSAK